MSGFMPPSGSSDWVFYDPEGKNRSIHGDEMRLYNKTEKPSKWKQLKAFCKKPGGLIITVLVTLVIVLALVGIGLAVFHQIASGVVPWQKS